MCVAEPLIAWSRVPSPPDHMNHVKILKGQPHQFALWELVFNWYKTFPPDHFGRVEMKQPVGLSNKTSAA